MLVGIISSVVHVKHIYQCDVVLRNVLLILK